MIGLHNSRDRLINDWVGIKWGIDSVLEFAFCSLTVRKCNTSCINKYYCDWSLEAPWCKCNLKPVLILFTFSLRNVYWCDWHPPNHSLPCSSYICFPTPPTQLWHIWHDQPSHPTHVDNKDENPVHSNAPAPYISICNNFWCADSLVYKIKGELYCWRSWYDCSDDDITSRISAMAAFSTRIIISFCQGEMKCNVWMKSICFLYSFQMNFFSVFWYICPSQST